MLSDYYEILIINNICIIIFQLYICFLAEFYSLIFSLILLLLLLYINLTRENCRSGFLSFFNYFMLQLFKCCFFHLTAFMRENSLVIILSSPFRGWGEFNFTVKLRIIFVKWYTWNLLKNCFYFKILAATIFLHHKILF